jgi:hypothetical protein
MGLVYLEDGVRHSRRNQRAGQGSTRRRTRPFPGNQAWHRCGCVDVDCEPVVHVLRSLVASLARSRRSEQILAADLIDRLRAEDKLREALQQLQLITANMAAK